MKVFKALTGERVKKIPVKDIYIHPSNIRMIRTEDKIAEMVESIKREGLQYPIKVVEEPTKKGRYGCFDGGYRLEASKRLGWKEIPALVESGTEEELMLRCWESDKSVNFKIVEEAVFSRRMFQRITGGRPVTRGMGGGPFKRVAEKVGKPYHVVRSRIQLLDLPEKIHKLLLEDEIPFRTVIAVRRQPRELWESIAERIEPGMRPGDVAKLAGKEKRVASISIVVTPKEKEKLAAAASERGMTVSGFCYSLVKTNPTSPVKEV